MRKYLTESTIKAEDYEAAIVLGFYNIQNRKIDNKTGIKPKVLEAVQKDEAALQAGKRIAEFCIKEYPSLKNAQAEQYGRVKSTLTSFWKSYGAVDVTPKTDVKVGNMCFSVKIGMAQLMSGNKNETSATFFAAIENSSSQIQKTEDYKNALGVLEKFVTSTVAPGKLRPLIKSGEIEVINDAEKAHKECMKHFDKLFESNEKFKIEFAREAMSGHYKFGKDSNSSADFMLVSNHNGSSVSIHEVSDDAYCKKIADKMKVQARFKTSGRRKRGKKTGEYNFWSVVSLIVDAIPSDVDESKINLNENILSNVVSKLKKIGTTLTTRIRGFFKKISKATFSYLGIEPEVTVKTKIKF